MSKPVEAGCGAAITDTEGRILLIQRLKEPEAGAWGLPGGKVDFGERAEDTARREIHEELGVEIELTGLACIAETIDAGDGRHWVAPVYSARILAGTPQVMEPEKHGGWGWFALDALPAPLTSPAKDWLKSALKQAGKG
ncbi:NUDIX domain-containing protein [Hyphomonas sp. WL0036]|uniref:NUDIX hydrolase n=1 Tax=Hyphomonas sediminis TaxID=2866160 RepID=UPI001C7EC518|nr:NUDIX domain-containing protein [Hyphomonas sediminis]MBY9068471.1 NUDIX domain-containing protein [Hyphomonas sediminis]